MKELKNKIKKFINYKIYIKRVNSVNSFNIIYFLVDLMFFLIDLFRHLEHARFKEFKKTKLLKNSYKDLNCFVFANGPSLNKIDFLKVRKLQKSGNFKVIAINSFVSYSDILDIVIPDIYVLSDPAFFGYYEGISEERKIEIIKNIKTLEKLDIVTFAPIQYYGKLKMKGKIYYFNDFEFRWFNKNVCNIIWPRSYLSMTAYKALAIACFLGFKKIYIAGFDNDWFKSISVNYNNEIFYVNNHFKKQKDSGLVKVNKRESENLGELLFSHSFLFLDLYKFPKEKIINLDPDSLVDAFSKECDIDVLKKF